MLRWNKDWLWQWQYPPHSLIDRSMAKRSRCRQSICKPLWYEHIACTAIVHVKKCIECLVPAYPRHLSWAAHLGAPHCRAAVSPNPVVGAASSSRTPVPLNTVNTPTFILTSIKTFHNPFVRRAATPPPASGDVCRWTVSMSPPEAVLFTSWFRLKYQEILYCLCLTWKSTSTNLVEKIFKNYRSCFIYAQYH